ncbi:hypothetical protein HL653_01165 [Sphingomonas sp. AP4-R1]|uniref:hypothetical protein n=1 Tax=Sphingomonas sp. AP4-R1 TaxID=2735134 RepID=UPI001493CC83|nr:hypothetical protein [Sphingomonas sp. AP4-R1]QJU56574.1 hypothetical protein HL653_01165 [Sphingomonas sp. AP4-R1]
MTAARRPFWRWLLLVWIAAAIFLIACFRSAIATFRLADPDDVLRLVEVRDWLGGQGWFDVSQHRMNPPHGLSMHWSRLLDLPIAACLSLARMVADQRTAETLAAVIVPLVTLGLAMALVAALTRRLTAEGAERGPALLAAAFCTISVAAWYALRPMRIDHHGWQIVAGLGVAVALTGRPTRRNAAIAGACAALWAHISLEALPFAAAAGAWLGLRAMLGARDDARRLSAYLAALTVAAAALTLAIKGPSAFAGLQCDSLSTVHLAALGGATLASLAAERAPLRARWIILVAAAGADALFYRWGAGPCAAGPFGQLGPLGARLWYRSVNEGQPIWRLSSELVLLWGLLPIVGLAGAAIVRRPMAPGPRREALTTYIVLLLAATGVGLLVMRALAFANLLALPGAMIALAVIARTCDRRARAFRILILTGSAILFSPLGPALAAALVSSERPAPQPPAPPAPACGRIDDYAVLNRLPPAIVIAPIDAGPALIAATHHRAITGPYHRDPQALEDLLRFFTAPPAEARTIAAVRHAGLLAFCPGAHDLGVMADSAPTGLAAALRRGAVPPWLTRLDPARTAPLQVYRIAGPR